MPPEISGGPVPDKWLGGVWGESICEGHSVQFHSTKQTLVSSLVAQFIANAFEVVQVDEEQCDLAGFKQLGQLTTQHVAVWQVSEFLGNFRVGFGFYGWLENRLR